MSWDKVKMGFFCDRCGAAIWMGIRQERFVQQDILRDKEVDLLLSSRRRKSGDPYISINRNAFFDGGDSTTTNRNYQFCFECEPVVMGVLEALRQGPTQVSDYSLCTNKTCPLRDNCKRAQAVPSNWQSYAHFSPNEAGRCVQQIPIKEPISAPSK